MSWLADWLGTAFIYALGWTLLHSLWQGALVAALLALVLAVTPRWSANARYVCAVSALGVVLVLAVLTYGRYSLLVEAALAKAVNPASEAALIDSSSVFSWKAIAHWLNRHMQQIVLLWLVGFTLFLARYCGGVFRCHRLKTRLSRMADSGWQRRVELLARRVGVGRFVVLKLTGQVAGPCVVGHFKPAILMPAALLTRLSPDELEAILLHELAHIRRNDYLVGLVQSLIKTLYFFNWPVLWISAQIDRERENACDDIAADGCKSRIFYAETLTRFSSLTMGPSASNDGGLTMAVNGKHHHLLARIQRLFEPTVTTARPFEGLLSSVILVALGLFLSVHSQAEDQYPDIETLDDASVESLIDTFRSQLLESDDENHFVTTLVPTKDYQALSKQEREAFVRHFKASLWEARLQDKKPTPFYDHLNEEEWLQARRVMFQQDFDHFIRALKGELRVLEKQEEWLPDQPQPMRFTRFEGGRMESEIPLSAVRSLLEKPGQAMETGAFFLRALGNGSFMLGLHLTDQVNELATERPVTREDLGGSLAGKVQSFSFNGDPEIGQVWSFAATDDFYQVWLSKQAVDSLLKGENSEGFDALSGYRVSREGMLEVAFDPKPKEQLNNRLMNFMDSKKLPSVEKRERELEDLLSKLPSDLHQYLYQEEHLERHFKAWSLRTGVEMSDRKERLFSTIFQKTRVEFLLEAAQDPERDALEMAHHSISVWANDVNWVNIYPAHKDGPGKLFDLIIEEQPVTEAVAQVAEVCEGIERPEGYEVVTQPVSLYGYETHCEQWQGVFEQLVENHSSLASS